MDTAQATKQRIQRKIEQKEFREENPAKKVALTRLIPNSKMFVLHTSKLASKQATTSACVVLYVCIDLKGLYRSVSE